jgi:hypothetical protein
MTIFSFRCPNTGLNVQGWITSLAAYFLSNTFLVFGLTQCVREQAVQVTGS